MAKRSTTAVMKPPLPRSEESRAERLQRVQQMADGGETWDLSENDRAALTTLLIDREQAIGIATELRQACTTALDLLQNMSTETFGLGGDRVIRERLTEAIERASLDLTQLGAKAENGNG